MERKGTKNPALFWEEREKVSVNDCQAIIWGLSETGTCHCVPGRSLQSPPWHDALFALRHNTNILYRLF
jgi:hypothetical protein